MRNSNLCGKSVRLGAAVISLLVCHSWGWSASGTVRNSSGTALSGVAVTVKDSAGFGAVTTSTGTFTIGSTMALLTPSTGSSWGARIAAGDLEIHTPLDGPMTLELFNGQGNVLWSGSAVAYQGSARLSAPVGLRDGAAFLRVRAMAGEFDVAVTTGNDGMKVASHIAAPRSLATYPTLQFKKSGYRDTTFAMASDMATDIAVTMGDTGSAATTCPVAKLAAGDQIKTLSIGTVSRSYILHVPSAYKGTEAAPLVVDFHPIGGSASGEEGSSPYKSLTDAEGVISAYPDGLASPNLGQAWNVQGCCTTANDTSFARAVVADVEKVACINPKRVYAVGFSMGGGMTHFSACHLADIFAAGAPAAFDLTQQNETACTPSRPITLVTFRSTGDGVVPYAGGHSALVTGMALDFLGAKGTFAKWASIDQCTDTPSAEDANGCSTYSKCAGGVQVTLCTKQGGTHEPGNASVGWPLLKKYTLP